MKVEDKVVNLAENDRTILDERIKTQTLTGQKIIAIGMALIASLMILFSVAKTNNLFGLGEAEKAKKAKVEVAGAVGPKAPAIIIPEPAPQAVNEQPAAQLISEATVCAGGLKLPKGMPCPEDNHQVMDGSKVAENSNSGQPKAPPRNEVLERKLRGGISVSSTVPAITPVAFEPEKNESSETKNASQGNGLTDAIPKTFTPRAQASINLNPSLTLAKGQLPDCNLAVAIRTSQPGFILCKTSLPVYSVDGKVVLMESGTTLEGEYRANIQNGQTAIQAIFTRARTPNNVIIPLDSPATDALGRSGIDGEIDQKWLQRFGGAIVSAVIEDFVDVYKSRQAQNNGNNNVTSTYPNTNSSTKAITDEFLRQGSQVRPDLVINQGKIVKVFVARDIDFSQVYQLNSTTQGVM